MITCHPRFVEMLCSEVKIGLLQLLLVLLRKECLRFKELLNVFYGCYFGTTSISDRILLEIFSVYECAGISCCDLITMWGRQPQPQPQPQLQLEALSKPIHNLKLVAVESIDADLMSKSIDLIEDHDIQNFKHHEFKRKNLYDPSFFMTLLAHVINDCDLKILVEKNLIGMAIKLMSSNYIQNRKSANIIMNALLQITCGKYKHLHLILSSFKNAITSDYEIIPGIISSFIKSAFKIVMKPSSLMYPIVNKFFLQRAIIDLEDVPMFYEMFFSSDGSFKQYRLFLLRLMLDGLTFEKDYHIYRRRRCIEILFAFYESSKDFVSRRLIQQV